MDEYNQEYSRDIEPMVGGHTDNYYYQMTGYIRKFKGVRPPQTATGNANIQIDGRFDDWKNVGPEFRDAIGDTMHRDHKGYGSTHYRDTTGRNDIVLCKMAADRENLYCFVQTREPITAFTDKNWMRLFLNTDGNPKTGWEGLRLSGQCRGCGCQNHDREKIRRRLGLEDGRANLVRHDGQSNGIDDSPEGSRRRSRRTVEFHWADNVQKDGDLAEFYVSGDSAPDGRYNYRFIPQDGSSR